MRVGTISTEYLEIEFFVSRCLIGKAVEQPSSVNRPINPRLGYELLVSKPKYVPLYCLLKTCGIDLQVQVNGGVVHL